MSPTLHRINIDQWRSSVPNTTESLTVPPLVGGRFPSHSRPLPPPTTTTTTNTLHHSSSATTSTSNRPSLLNLTALTSSASDEEVESRSGSEMVSERSGKKEEADRLVGEYRVQSRGGVMLARWWWEAHLFFFSSSKKDSTLELLLSVWPSPPSSLAPLTPPISTSSSDSGTDSDDAVPLRTFVNEILRRSRSSCATLRAARLYLEVGTISYPIPSSFFRRRRGLTLVEISRRTNSEPRLFFLLVENGNQLSLALEELSYPPSSSPTSSFTIESTAIRLGGKSVDFR